MDSNCIFCKIASGEIPSEAVYSDDEFHAFRDLNPQAPTHILIIPKRHIARITDAGDVDAALLGRLMLRANAIAETEGVVNPGFRYVLNCNPGGGQSVYHIHLHLLGGRQMTWPPG